MAEIIPFPGKKRPKAPNEERQPSLSAERLRETEEALRALRGDVEPDQGEVTRLRGTSNRAENMRGSFSAQFRETRDFLATLVLTDSRAHNQINIAQRREILKGWEDIELIRAIKSGNQLSWKKSPSWYCALLDEIRSRRSIQVKE